MIRYFFFNDFIRLYKMSFSFNCCNLLRYLFITIFLIRKRDHDFIKNFMRSVEYLMRVSSINRDSLIHVKSGRLRHGVLCKSAT